MPRSSSDRHRAPAPNTLLVLCAGTAARNNPPLSLLKTPYFSRFKQSYGIRASKFLCNDNVSIPKIQSRAVFKSTLPPQELGHTITICPCLRYGLQASAKGLGLVLYAGPTAYMISAPSNAFSISVSGRDHRSKILQDALCSGYFRFFGQP